MVAVKDARNVRRSQSGTWAYLEVAVARKAIRMEVSVATDAFLPVLQGLLQVDIRELQHTGDLVSDTPTL